MNQLTKTIKALKGKGSDPQGSNPQPQKAKSQLGQTIDTFKKKP